MLSVFEQIWDIRASQCLETTCRHEGTVHGLCKANPSHLISASLDKTIRVWNVDTFQQVQLDDRHEAEVTALHANARHIVSGANDAKIKVIANADRSVPCTPEFFRLDLGLRFFIRSFRINDLCLL